MIDMKVYLHRASPSFKRYFLLLFIGFSLFLLPACPSSPPGKTTNDSEEQARQTDFLTRTRELMSRVEKMTKKSFTSRPVVRVPTDKEWKKAIRERYEKIDHSLMTQLIGGLYLPESKEILLQPSMVKSAGAKIVDLIIVHELTHHLDEEHFQLTSRILSAKGNKRKALKYLAEGHAVLIEEQVAKQWDMGSDYVEKRYSGVLAQHEPYLVGWRFLKELKEKKGRKAITDLLKKGQTPSYFQILSRGLEKLTFPETGKPEFTRDTDEGEPLTIRFNYQRQMDWSFQYRVQSTSGGGANATMKFSLRTKPGGQDLLLYLKRLSTSINTGVRSIETVMAENKVEYVRDGKTVRLIKKGEPGSASAFPFDDFQKPAARIQFNNRGILTVKTVKQNTFLSTMLKRLDFFKIIDPLIASVPANELHLEDQWVQTYPFSMEKQKFIDLPLESSLVQKSDRTSGASICLLLSDVPIKQKGNYHIENCQRTIEIDLQKKRQTSANLYLTLTERDEDGNVKATWEITFNGSFTAVK